RTYQQHADSTFARARAIFTGSRIAGEALRDSWHGSAWAAFGKETGFSYSQCALEPLSFAPERCICSAGNPCPSAGKRCGEYRYSAYCSGPDQTDTGNSFAGFQWRFVRAAFVGAACEEV